MHQAHGLLYHCAVVGVWLLAYCLVVTVILWLFASERIRFAARERRREIVLHIRPSDLPIFIPALTNQAAQVSGQGIHHGHFHN